MSKFVSTIKAAAQDFSKDECMVSGAALAYYTIFSLPPLLVMVFYVAGLFGVSEGRINEIVSAQIGVPVPGSSTSEGEEQQDEEGKDESSSLEAVANRRGEKGGPLTSLGPVSKLVGVGLLIFSATGLFAQLQRALNRAWEVEPDPEKGGWKNFVAKRGLSLGMIVVFAFLLLVSLVLTTILEELVNLIAGEPTGTFGKITGNVINESVTLAMATLLFAAMYKILPDADMRWKDIWVGAFITAGLFDIGKFAIGTYLQNSQIGSVWGSAAASMIAMLVWVYYTALIVLFGAELTQAWATNYGAGIVPSHGAVRVVQQKKHVRDT